MAKKKNNPFTDLERSYSRDFREGQGHQNVQKGLDGTLGTARMLGSIADVYLSRFIGTVMGMAGSSKDDAQTKPSEGGRGSGNHPVKGKNPKYPNL